jgi:hypothetical protein
MDRHTRSVIRMLVNRQYTMTQWSAEAFEILYKECENAGGEKKEKLARFLISAPGAVQREYSRRQTELSGETC